MGLIRVGRRKQATSRRSRKTGEIERRMTTRWTIEAPRWKKRDDLFVGPGVDAKDLFVLVNSWIAPRR